MTVVEVEDGAERSRIAERVLRDLPEWPTPASIGEVAHLTTFAVDDVGFLCLKQPTPRTAEISVMGVRRARHREGIGRALVRAAEAWCSARGIDYLQVGPTTNGEEVGAFFEAVGFASIAPPPQLQLVKRVERGFSVFPLPGIPELRRATTSQR